MKMLTTRIVAGLDNKPRFAIVEMGETGRPLAVGGLVDGPESKKSQAEAMFLADAMAMRDILEALRDQFKDLDLTSPLDQYQMSNLKRIVTRADTVVQKHRDL